MIWIKKAMNVAFPETLALTGVDHWQKDSDMSNLPARDRTTERIGNLHMTDDDNDYNKFLKDWKRWYKPNIAMIGYPQQMNAYFEETYPNGKYKEYRTRMGEENQIRRKEKWDNIKSTGKDFWNAVTGPADKTYSGGKMRGNQANMLGLAMKRGAGGEKPQEEPWGRNLQWKKRQTGSY